MSLELTDREYEAALTRVRHYVRGRDAKSILVEAATMLAMVEYLYHDNNIAEGCALARDMLAFARAQDGLPLN